MREIHFTLPMLLPTRNAQDRLHYHQKRAFKDDLARQISAAVVVMPASPFDMASISVWRHSLVEPDTDGLYGSLKQLLDVLQPQGKLVTMKGKRQFQNPQGLGMIASDKPSSCLVLPRWIKAKHRPDQKTVVIVRELLEMPQVAA